MRCASCGLENAPGSRFCIECGTALARRCQQCGRENPPEAKFCGECGISLATPAPSALPLQGEKPEAERRQLTVMFCDLVGSTALSAQLDPEDLREVVRTYQDACAVVISRFDGHIAQYLGDGLLVYFGYPRAHEDDAQRAVQAGLGILTEIQRLNTQSLLPTGIPLPLRVRIGIHTGLVVVGEMGGGDKRDPMAVVGETPNIAARLQGIADPDTVVISATTHRLTEGYFECLDLGSHTVKGISTPLPVYRVLSGSGRQSRLEVAASTGLIPLVGREKEVGLLLERWEQVKEGMGQVVLLSGEAGIGKSRLVQALSEQVTQEGFVKVECRCSPYYQDSAFYPVVEHLQRLLRFRREDSPEEKLRKLEKTLERRGGFGSHSSLSLQEAVSLMASLLSLPLPERYPPLSLSPQRQKQKILEVLLAWILKEAEQWPVLLIMEDLHWIDPTTLELLGLLLEQAPASRICVLLTFRPDFSPPWAVRAHVSRITLGRLTHRQVKTMVEKIAGGQALPTEVLQQVIAKTDGVPLFVEELTKMVLESGLLRAQEGRYELTGPLPPLAIPTTLQDSLMARLDRLATVKEVAQLGATVGREFSYELLKAISPLDETHLQNGLAQLVEAELLYQRGFPPQTVYLFKHALIQETAYQSLLKSRRQQYHQKVAQVLEERFPETVSTEPELLAHHYTEAGLKRQAVTYWQKAGQRAVHRSANTEAIRHLTKGLDLLKTLPDTPERAQLELGLQITLGAPLTATKGYAAVEVGQVYTRARELCQQVGETPQLIPVLFGLWRFYLQRAELQTARELAEQCLSVAQHVSDAARLLRAHTTLGVTLFYLGELVSAREHFEQGIALYSPQLQRRRPSVQDPMVACLSYAAWTLWHLGYPDQALQRSQQAVALAEELSHPYSLAMALFFAAELHLWRREVQLTKELAEAAITLSSEREFRFWLAQCTCLRGWALVEQGEREEGIGHLREGLAAYQATGATLGPPYYVALLAEGYGRIGQAREGLSLLGEALAEVEKSGERFYQSRLYRLKGQLTLQSQASRRPLKEGQDTSVVSSPLPSARGQEAEACFRQAIDIARSQSAKSLELQAVMSLSRLLQQQGKQDEGRRLLAEIYTWFPEGFDTPDLQEARRCLQEWS